MEVGVGGMTKTLDDESIAALARDEQLTREIEELLEKRGKTRADQDRLNTLTAEKLRLR